MWTSNSKNMHNLNPRAIPIDQNKNNYADKVPIYQTPIKQSLNAQGNIETPLQIDFNFYFGNLWSSGHIPAQQIEIPNNNSVTQHNRESNLLLFKSSLEKSGYKLTPISENKNGNIIDFGITNNLNNIYENELNQNEFTKKNLNELFNNAKNDEFLQSNTKINNMPNNSLENNNIYYYNNINNNGNNIIIPNNSNNKQNINIKKISINNNIYNNADYEEEDYNKENKNNNVAKKGNYFLNENYEKKNINNNYNCLVDGSKENDKNGKKNLNEKNEVIFSSPINKKPKKIFECSGSTLATNSSKSSTRKRRFRKNNEQLNMLSQFFNEHKHWSKNQIKEISQRTGLKENKVYKWLWDQRNKEYKQTKFIINKNNLP